jgi:UDP-N-acetylmuramate--alanine ligase
MGDGAGVAVEDLVTPAAPERLGPGLEAAFGDLQHAQPGRPAGPLDAGPMSTNTAKRPTSARRSSSGAGSGAWASVGLANKNTAKRAFRVVFKWSNRLFMIQRRRPVPFELGPVHFIGIGGIGMSGIAEIMIRIGYTVQGSDAKASANTERLEKLGARIFIGHDAANVEGASAIVYSTAVKADNPEMVAGRDKRLPLVRRAEMLAELMRLQFSIAVGGTHGKTTTTSMVAALLDAGALDPTVVNGGIINAYGTNAKVGEGDWIVVEADESDGSFLKLKSTVAIVTNIDAEHLDHWGDFDAVKKGFQDFIENIPFYGFAAVCTDHPEVQALTSRIENRRLVTYGVNPQAEVRVSNIEMGPDGSTFDIIVSPLRRRSGAL